MDCAVFLRKPSILFLPGWGKARLFRLVLGPAFFLFMVLGVPVSAGGPRSDSEKLLKPKAMRADLAFLMKTLEEVHPNPYAYTSKQKVQAMLLVLTKKIDHPMNQTEFAAELAAIIASLKDAHSSVTVPKYFKAGQRLFPLKVHWQSGKIMITWAISPSDKDLEGTELVSINGVGATPIWERLVAITSGERVEVINGHVGWEFPLLLSAVLKLEAPFKVSFRKPGEPVVQEKTIAGITIEELNPSTPNSERKTPDYNFEELDGAHIGLIRFRHFEDLEKFNVFLRQTFTQIRESGVTGLIIDIRDNPGGNSALGDALVDYITDKPWQGNSVQTKISRQIKKYLKGDIFKTDAVEGDPETRKLIRQIYLGIASLPNGSVQETPENKRVTQPKSNPLRFSGPVYILANLGSFSSASDFASWVKDNKVAVLVGEETGGLASCFGDTYEFNLPRSGIEVGLSWKYFLRPAGYDDGRGVLPDYEVHQDQADREKGVDTVLSFTRELILKQRMGSAK